MLHTWGVFSKERRKKKCTCFGEKGTAELLSLSLSITILDQLFFPPQAWSNYKSTSGGGEVGEMSNWSEILILGTTTEEEEEEEEEEDEKQAQSKVVTFCALYCPSTLASVIGNQEPSRINTTSLD